MNIELIVYVIFTMIVAGISAAAIGFAIGTIRGRDDL